MRRRLPDAEARIRRFQAAIAAGVDPMAVVEPLNQAQAERAAAEAEVVNVPEAQLMKDAEVYAMLDSLGDIEQALSGTSLEAMADLYRTANLELGYKTQNRPSM